MNDPMRRDEGDSGVDNAVRPTGRRKRGFALPNDFFFWFPLLLMAVYAAYLVFDALTSRAG